ncbi:uncharacterized protein N7482_001494 [Penicillium canariense]|uniref:Uncharacterized protein n=1 Tax=Penicillium canariense TaxID=189055 RepID=A0A9W9IFV5_9EURO|nr:uncharacterized protein N7482_001494 [Penicillium canariense]KAJ5175617.1 hypothetical protein N7482_001494 [Penicillium canariense]
MEAVRDSVPLQRLSQSSEDRAGDDRIPEYDGRDSASSTSGATPMHDEELPSYSQVRSTGQIIGRGHSTLLHRSAWVTLITIIYVTLAIYAWTMTVVLSYHPIKAKSWGYNIANAIYEQEESKIDFARSARIYRSARTLQSIVQVATLPWITAVCASAAVIYTQNQKNTGLRLRQVTTLADRRWDDPSLYLSLAQGRWKQHGSALLWVAMIIYIFGAITYPIQSLFLTTQTIKIPTEPSNRAKLNDFNTADYQYIVEIAAGLDMLQTRSALSQADGHTYYPNIWSNNSGVQFITLNELSSETFYSQLPNGFNTGLLRQFAPRVNSTASSETILADQFPTNCSTEAGALYLDYQTTYTDRKSTYISEISNHSYYGLIACMPASSTKSRWQMTRNRQDFTEVLYLNLTGSDIATSSSDAAEYLYKITVSTTSGYFELPNYMNNNTPGPLLESDPEDLCDEKCMNQSSRDSWQTWNYKYARRSTTTNTSTLEAGSLSPLNTTYKGPLLMTALATFGPNSFIDTFPASYAAIEAESKATSSIATELSDACIANPPLSNLLLDTSEGESLCVYADIWYGEWYPAGSSISQWLSWFTNYADRLPTAFTAAAYLSNAQLLATIPGSWYVYQDLGENMEIPSISLTGIIVVSVLMGVYLLPLLALSLYAGYFARWTGRLDSFAMLRFGAFAGDKVFPMLVGRKADSVAELDEMSGVVRDVARAGAENEVIPIGRLGFGEGRKLKSKRRYECFKGDDEPLNPQEFQRVQWRVHHRG